MNTLKILSKKEKQELVEKLNKQFGIKKVNGIISTRGERLFIFQGNFDEKQIRELESTIPIERVGIYFGKQINNEIRLSIDGIHLLKDQINKNILELNEEQTEYWMKGNELNILTEKRGFVIIKYNDNFIGTGKASENKITNFIPKNRRLKEKG
ncbi:MAG: hypothetical protein ABH811_01305 [archaeon]